MDSLAADDHTRPPRLTPKRRKGDDSVKASLDALENKLGEAGTSRGPGDRMFEGDCLEAFGAEMRRLHARLRLHDSASFLASAEQPKGPLPPELIDEWHRLRDEHPRILGELDRLIRTTESIADRSLEDKDVFVMRTRELIATLRRHEAEENRLFHIAVWRDTGGES